MKKIVLSVMTAFFFAFPLFCEGASDSFSKAISLYSFEPFAGVGKATGILANYASYTYDYGISVKRKWLYQPLSFASVGYSASFTCRNISENREEISELFGYNGSAGMFIDFPILFKFTPGLSFFYVFNAGLSCMKIRAKNMYDKELDSWYTDFIIVNKLGFREIFLRTRACAFGAILECPVTVYFEENRYYTVPSLCAGMSFSFGGGR